MSNMQPITDQAEGSLFETCVQQLLSGKMDAAQLEQLPPHILTKLLLDKNAESSNYKSQLGAANEQLQSFKEQQERRYIIDPPCFQDRVGEEMEARVEGVRDKWEPSQDESLDGSDLLMHCDVQWSFEKHAFIHIPRDTWPQLKLPKCAMLSDVISSALWLYRGLALFPSLHIQNPQDWYKCLYQAALKHKATGRVCSLYEHKGAAQMNVGLGWEEKWNDAREFELDVLELLNLLCDPRCPHTYDGTVAGSVA